MKRICVNCGSNPGFDPVYLAAAEQMGQALAEHQLGLVYGGSNIGVMGKVADTVLAGSGTAIGVIPEMFADKVGHPGLTELRIVSNMHVRKKMMFDLSDGFIALPGGFGTLDEMMELLTWSQLGINPKPCGLLNVNGYFDHLLAFFDNAASEGFVRIEHQEMLIVSDEPEEILNRFKAYVPPSVEKWRYS